MKTSTIVRLTADHRPNPELFQVTGMAATLPGEYGEAKLLLRLESKRNGRRLHGIPDTQITQEGPDA